MKWFQIKEQSAGRKRLLLSWYLYKIFGKNILYIIAFLVSFFTFTFSSKVRTYSKKYFQISYPYLKIKPTLFNQLKHIYSYAESLVDKVLVYSNNYDSNNVIFEDNEDNILLNNDLKNKTGIFFICNHIGNIEIFRSHLLKDSKGYNFSVNIFISQKQSQIFNSFINDIKKDDPIKIFKIEEISIETGIELKENLDKGDVVFIAGDRLSQTNDAKNIKSKLFNQDIYLPKGTFKLAKLMDAPTYFISAIKDNKKYKIILEKQNDLSEKVLAKNFTDFMQKAIEINPYQFFHFYDFFN